MPLLPGKKAVGANIGELEHAYEEKGKIGNVQPRSKAHARRIAVAIAMDKARESGGDGRLKPAPPDEFDKEREAQRERGRRRRGKR